MLVPNNRINETGLRLLPKNCDGKGAVGTDQRIMFWTKTTILRINYYAHLEDLKRQKLSDKLIIDRMELNPSRFRCK